MELCACSVHISYKKGKQQIPDEYISDLQRKGLTVYAWTVNNESKMIKLESNNVDGIFTDDINIGKGFERIRVNKL